MKSNFCSISYNSLFILIVLWYKAPNSILRAHAHNREPNRELKTIEFDYSVQHRRNYCDYEKRYSRGEVDLKDALSGTNLNVVILNSPDYLQLDKDENLHRVYAGINVELMDELARRGNFTWRDSFVIADYLTENSTNTWTEYLEWMTDTYDVSLTWWLHTPERVAKGISFPTGWYKASIIIVGGDANRTPSSKFAMFAWTTPFEDKVWLLMIAMFLISGLALMFVDKPKTGKNLRSSFDMSMQSLMVFTGHLDLEVHTPSAQIISLSLAFFAMIMTSTYTASLASFLVVKNIPRESINHVGDIVNKQYDMCILGDSAMHDSIIDKYPKANVLSKTPEEEVFKALNNGECNFAITTEQYWKEIERSPYNKYCNLTHIGRRFEKHDSGFATKGDSGTFCTTLVRDVIDIHMREMIRNGFVENAWNNHYDNLPGTHMECSATNNIVQEDISDTTPLNLTNMGGIFLFHFSFLTFAVVLSLYTRYKDALFRNIFFKRVTFPFYRYNKECERNGIEERILDLKTKQSKTLSDLKDSRQKLEKLIDHIQTPRNSLA